MTKLYGYYESANQPADQPTFNPEFDALCLHCNEPIYEGNMRTISMMAMPETKPGRAYFYRVHKSCDESASEKQKINIDTLIWNQIRVNKD